MNSTHSLFLVVTSAFLLTSVAVAKPAFPSKIPYQGFSCSTCHDGSPGLASMNDFANDFKAAGNTWTKDLCEMDSDGDGASNGVELLDPTATGRRVIALVRQRCLQTIRCYE